MPDKSQWTILGAGRLGLGVLAPLANSLEMSSLLVVAGENTSREQIKHYNEVKNYSIMLDKPLSERTVFDYQFVTRSDIDTIVNSIASLRTRVVSTSVGEDRLPEVLPILVAGLRERAKHGSEAEATGLLLLICENGRGPDGRPRAASVREELKEMLEPDLDSLVEMPTVVLDSIVPHLLDTNLRVKVSRGDIWMEETSLTRELFENTSSVHLTSAADISFIHTRKLYCVNTLHLLLSVSGALAREETVQRIATDRSLAPYWSKICDSLAVAACASGDLAVDQKVGNSSTADYAKEALKRLRLPPWPDFDDVERAMTKLRRGWYLDDGRIDGPVVDAGLVEAPDKHPTLVHAIALALYSVVGSINALAQRFACVPGESPPARSHHQSVRNAFASGLALASESPFTDGNERSALIEALARDFQYLTEVRPSAWNPTMLAKFLRRPISTDLQALPRRAGDIRCVMFDLDEGLVATESLLYRVTRELIAKKSHNGSTLTHDEYAKHVGSPEPEFFQRMVSRFQISTSSSKDLVREREDRFLEALDEVDSQILLKPGFRALLEILADKGVVMAVCSNASERRVGATLARAGIRNYFEEVITPIGEFLPKGSSIGPSMYEEVRKTLTQKREHCVVVESSLVGVSAAVDAGMYTLLVINDYTQPRRAARAGVQVLGNAQVLQTWFKDHFGHPPARI